MMQLNDKIIIASAGSGKTTMIVDEAIKNKDKILILTYTRDNLSEIKEKFIRLNDVVPANVIIKTWFSFLLNDCARPYQNFLYDKRIKTIQFVQSMSTRGTSMSDVENYYFNKAGMIYSDKIGGFVCKCNEISEGLVINRLEEIYDYIYIDEVQDLAGYDLELLKLLVDSEISVKLVGDIRQVTYSTNNAGKNRQYRDVNIINFFEKISEKQNVDLVYKNISHRCNQKICNLADSLYPDLPDTSSLNEELTEHDGIYIIKKENVEDYVEKFSPQILRYDKRTKLFKDKAMNFGQAKGLSFDRVLILPNGPIQKFLKTGNIKKVKKSRAKFYVALTRARYSVAFLYSGEVNLEGVENYNLNI
jgi:DNA helicase-2/ATP-dependent DNA helicase PcrA